MTLGLRPECIRPAALDGAPLAARVQVVERLGERTLLHVVLDDGTPIVAEDGGLSAVRPGDRIGLAVQPDRAHLFDADGLGHHPARPDCWRAPSPPPPPRRPGPPPRSSSPP